MLLRVFALLIGIGDGITNVLLHMTRSLYIAQNMSIKLLGVLFCPF